jgi:hypothetical protein
MFLDFEHNSQGATMTLADAEAFVTRIHDQTGRFPGLYSDEFFITSARKQHHHSPKRVFFVDRKILGNDA